MSYCVLTSYDGPSISAAFDDLVMDTATSPGPAPTTTSITDTALFGANAAQCYCRSISGTEMTSGAPRREAPPLHTHRRRSRYEPPHVLRDVREGRGCCAMSTADVDHAAAARRRRDRSRPSG
eukprot:3177644-Rhodomonas_salina.2